MIFKFHLLVKTERAVAVGCSALLAFRQFQHTLNYLSFRALHKCPLEPFRIEREVSEEDIAIIEHPLPIKKSAYDYGARPPELPLSLIHRQIVS
jgi:hypothetical protein